MALFRALGSALSIFLLWMLLCCVVDRFAHFSREVRLASLAAALLFVIVRLIPVLRARRREPDLIGAAAEFERQDPRFGQRLMTVTSRMMGATDYRGSDEILMRLAREVDEQFAAHRGAISMPLRRAIAPCAAAIVLVCLMIGLLRAPDLRFGALAGRFLDPFAVIPPVTTTQLTVSPGDSDIVQSRPLTITVQATRLGTSPVQLFLGDDDRHWSHVTMTQTGTDAFSFTLAAVDRDFRYYLIGGDARTPEFLIRVLRRPAVALFRIEYQYPAYTQLPPTVVTNADGQIEAPAGTKATLTLTATEPLQAALLTIGGEKILMDRTSDPRSRRAQIEVRSDMRYSLDLISTRDVAGAGPSASRVRAIQDLPPQVRLARSGESLRLDARVILALSYDAMDDYGLRSLALKVRVNDQKTKELPVQRWGDPRRQQDVYDLDLATFPLGIGDVVKLTMVAGDSAGHSVESEALLVLVSPHSVDLDTYERISELNNARQLAQSLTAQLDDAAKAQDEAIAQKDHGATVYQSATSRGDRSLSAASQTGTLLRQSLLRAITRSGSRQLSVAVANWVDMAGIETAAAEDAFRQSGIPTGMSGPARERLHHAAEQSRELQKQLAIACGGEQASEVLADRENLLASEKQRDPKEANARRLRHESVSRMRQDIIAEAGQIGLDAGAADFHDQLRSRVSAEKSFLDAAKSVDFVAAARTWADELQHDPQQRHGLEARLSAAAQAEAIRPDADLIRAHDLELASRAASAIASSGRVGGKQISAGLLDSFVGALNVLHRMNDIEHPSSGTPSPAELQAARTAGAKARQDLAHLLGDSNALAATTSAATRGAVAGANAHPKESEDLAMQASAAAAEHQYDSAATLDQSLIDRLEAGARSKSSTMTAQAEPDLPGERIEHHRQAVNREMAAARKIDDLGEQQRQLAHDAAEAHSADLAGRQQGVAEQIAQVERQRGRQSPVSPPVAASDLVNERDRAASVVLEAQDELSGLPQKLAAALASASACREAKMRAAQAAQSATSAAAAQRDAADRAADQARQSAQEATDRLLRELEHLTPVVAQQMCDHLEPYTPECDATVAIIHGGLAPSLESLQQAARGDDAGATSRAADEARRMIQNCQVELAGAQDALVRRDPLAAATSFAQAAARSLSLRPPDMGTAMRHQANVSQALSRAWDQSIHRAAAERLASVPSMAGILDRGFASVNTMATGQQKGVAFLAAREWSRLRPQAGPDVNSTRHDTDPPGFEGALKLYFEALGKAPVGK
jgi:hypothetical protein